MDKPLHRSLALLLSSTLVSGLFVEMAVRWWGHADQDGNFFLGPLRCYPYHVPVSTLKSKIDQYLSSHDSFLMYDSLVGWAPRPNSESRDGLYRYNEDAIRTASRESVISRLPRHGVLRVAIFGDSFTHGNEVAFDNTWGYYLEGALRQQGTNAEVLNFGVSGYGMDQSFLRWRQTGSTYQPHVVIVGVQPENLNRNANLIRALYSPETKVPFSKPRFILDQDHLKLVNSPTVAPEALPETMDAFESWQWSPYEYWYERDKYKDDPWFSSKLIACMSSSIGSRDHGPRARPEDLDRLGLRILSAFKTDVESHGGTFSVVYLPLREDLSPLLDGKAPAHSEFLEGLEAVVPVIHPETGLVQEVRRADMKTLFRYHHYSARANAIVAGTIANDALFRRQNPSRARWEHRGGSDMELFKRMGEK